uniref:BTB domain-containing protein n=1 Tax=Anopheles culicifacies TaxID=139723 RepID=A0A182M9P6_9DIPT
MNPQQFSLRWNNYTSYIAGAFDSLRYEEDLVDVTLCCEGRKIRAHKILLSACSPYFKDVFKENPCQHPVIIFKNVRHTDLMSLVEFMYQGEVSVPQEQLPSFLHTAEILAIRGLTDNTADSRQPASSTTSAIAQQLIQSQAVLDKSATLTTADSLYLTLPSNSTIVHQPKLPNTSVPSGSTVTVTTTSTGQSGETEIYETDTYTITTKEARDDQDHEQYTENGQTSGATLKMEIPEFISVGEPINTGNGTNNTFLQESYELVSENIEEKDDDEDMAQDNIEIEGSDMDMSRIFQGSTDEQTKSNILQDTELRFRCSICWKGFKHPMSLTLHKDLHSGKTKCPVCLRSFSRSYDMRIHLNKIHQVTLKLDARFNLKSMKSE